MAKYKVLSYEHNIRDNGNGYDNLYLSLKLQNAAGNPASREYRIAPDDNHRNLTLLTNTILNGLNLALQTGAKIELSEYAERMYLTLELPTTDGKHSVKVTAEKI